MGATRSALTAAGFKAEHYVGHSFQIGAATTGAQKGIQDSLIKTLGRWESAVYTIDFHPLQKRARSSLSGNCFCPCWVWSQPGVSMTIFNDNNVFMTKIKDPGVHCEVTGYVSSEKKRNARYTFKVC